MTPTSAVQSPHSPSIKVERIIFNRPGMESPLTSREEQPVLVFTQSLLGTVNLGEPIVNPPQKQAKLFLVPTPLYFNDERGGRGDDENVRKPSPLCELPHVNQTVERYVLGVVEILGGRRNPMQLARASHRLVYQKILELSGAQLKVPVIRKIYTSQPIEGVLESTVTLRFGDRVRSMALRFEGVDKRWLCTELILI